MPDTANILIVDEDEMLSEILEAALYLHHPGYCVMRANGIEAAAGIVTGRAIDVVITELEFHNGGDIAQFLLGLSAADSPPAVLALTARPLMSGADRFRVNAWISKPPEPDAFLRRVDELVNFTRGSVLRGISLDGFLQLVGHDRKTCTITVTSGRRTGNLYVRRGELIHAEAGAEQSRAAALAMLAWQDCTIRVADRCDSHPTIHENLTNLLLEACVRRDNLAGSVSSNDHD
jgi:DNA-binding response OmpR family regulator